MHHYHGRYMFLSVQEYNHTIETNCKHKHGNYIQISNSEKGREQNYISRSLKMQRSLAHKKQITEFTNVNRSNVGNRENVEKRHSKLGSVGTQKSHYHS